MFGIMIVLGTYIHVQNFYPLHVVQINNSVMQHEVYFLHRFYWPFILIELTLLQEEREGR